MVDQEPQSAATEQAQTPVAQETVNAPQSPDGANVMALRKIQNIKVNVQAVLGSVSLSVSQLANLKKGEFLQLDTKIGDTIDILANGQLIAKGEIAVVEGEHPKFGITLTEIIDTNLN